MRIRSVADIHGGSYWGLLPPNFEFDGQQFPQNKGQVYTWECWMHMIETAPKPDIVVVGGDVHDGDQRKSGGVGVITPDIQVQSAVAIQVLEPLVSPAERWYLCRGTPFHETNFDYVARYLKAEEWPSGGRHGWVLDLEVEGVNFNFAHHPMGGSAMYKGTTLDREGLWAIISASIGKVPHADVIVRSHNHFFACFKANRKTVVATPCWQLITPYAIKNGYWRWQPDLGFVDFILTGDPTHPVRIEEHLYPLPPKEIVHVPSTRTVVRLDGIREGTAAARRATAKSGQRSAHRTSRRRS